MQTSAQTADGVLATVDYVSAESRSNLRYVGDGREVNTGVFDPHQVFMHNARRAAAPMTLATCGFQLATHQSAVDFYDDAGAEAAYAAEIGLGRDHGRRGIAADEQGAGAGLLRQPGGHRVMGADAQQRRTLQQRPEARVAGHIGVVPIQSTRSF